MKPSLIIAGLGNPGRGYERTRHNIGFQAVDVLSKEFGQGEWEDRGKFTSFVQEARVIAAPVLLVKPQMYMNRSGEALKKMMDFYKLEPSQLLVLSDDVDLPLGEIRFRKSGGPGTHNGLKSIVLGLGEGFPRMRIGLGQAKPGEDLANWVLSVPSAEEKKILDDAYAKLPEMIREFMLGK